MWLPCVYLCFFVALFLFSFWAFSLQISIIFCRLPHALSVNKPACVLIHFSLLLFCTAFSLVAMIVSYHSILAGCVSPLFSSVSGKKKTQTDRKCTKESRRILMKFFLALFHSENSTNCIGDFVFVNILAETPYASYLSAYRWNKSIPARECDIDNDASGLTSFYPPSVRVFFLYLKNHSKISFALPHPDYDSKAKKNYNEKLFSVLRFTSINLHWISYYHTGLTISGADYFPLAFLVAYFCCVLLPPVKVKILVKSIAMGEMANSNIQKCI